MIGCPVVYNFDHTDMKDLVGFCIDLELYRERCNFHGQHNMRCAVYKSSIDHPLKDADILYICGLRYHEQVHVPPTYRRPLLMLDHILADGR